MYQKIKRSFKEQYKELRISLSAANNLLFTGYYKYLFSPKKNTLNHFLHLYSLSQPDFTVIQVGANDGITHDPIHKFIKRDHWQGVLLEPQPNIFEKYLSRIYKKNKSIETICAAIGDKDGYQKLYKIAFSDMRWATGLASFNLPNLQKALENGYVQANCEKYGIDLPTAPEEQITSEEIKMITPQTLMKEHGIEQIHLLQVDTEGYDFEVIKLFEIEKTQPRVIIYENAHLSAQHLSQCNKLLQENEYAVKSIGKNDVAMKKPLGQFQGFFDE